MSILLWTLLAASIPGGIHQGPEVFALQVLDDGSVALDFHLHLVGVDLEVVHVCIGGHDRHGDIEEVADLSRRGSAGVGKRSFC